MARLQVILDALQVQDEAVGLRTRPLTREQYRDFCRANPDLRIERLASGEVMIMPPVHSRGAAQNAEILFQLTRWAKADGRGVPFDSSAGFDLPNGANRSPDAAWVLRSRIAALRPEETEEYLPLSPDFVVQLRSKSDSLPELREKMQEYVANGTRLGWLIDPIERQVHIYRPGVAVECLTSPPAVTGDPELPGFQLDLAAVWNPGV